MKKKIIVAIVILLLLVTGLHIFEYCRRVYPKEYNGKIVYLNEIHGNYGHYKLIMKNKYFLIGKKTIANDLDTTHYQLSNGKVYYYDYNKEKVISYDITQNTYATINCPYSFGAYDWKVCDDNLYFGSGEENKIIKYNQSTQEISTFFNSYLDSFSWAFYEDQYCFLLYDHDIYTLDLNGNITNKYHIDYPYRLFGNINIVKNELHVYKTTATGGAMLVPGEPIIIDVNELI